MKDKLSVTQRMALFIDRCFSNKPKLKQWVWFVLLWLSGLMLVLSISLVIKLIFLSIS